MTRLVVVTNGNHYARVILRELLEVRASDVVGVVTVTGDYTGKTGLASILSVARKTTFPYFAAKVLQAVAHLGRGALEGVRHNSPRPPYPTVQVARVDGMGVARKLQEWAPDMLVSVSCPQRIPSGLFEKLPLGGLNVHSSLLPAYAGLAPYYWVLAEGATQTGVTVHTLTAKFDEGSIVAQRSIDVMPGQGAFALFDRLAILGSHALSEAVRRVEAGYPGEPQDPTKRSYFSHPNTRSYKQLRRHGHAILRPSDVYRILRYGHLGTRRELPVP